MGYASPHMALYAVIGYAACHVLRVSCDVCVVAAGHDVARVGCLREYLTREKGIVQRPKRGACVLQKSDLNFVLTVCPSLSKRTLDSTSRAKKGA